MTAPQLSGTRTRYEKSAWRILDQPVHLIEQLRALLYLVDNDRREQLML
jgi:hypothetical protein